MKQQSSNCDLFTPTGSIEDINSSISSDDVTIYPSNTPDNIEECTDDKTTLTHKEIAILLDRYLHITFKAIFTR